MRLRGYNRFFLFSGLFLVLGSIIFFQNSSPNQAKDGMVSLPELTVDRSEAFIIGTVGENPDKERAEFQEFADYLADNLSDQGIKEGYVTVTERVIDMASLLSKGEVDIYIDSPFPVFAADHFANSVPIANRWKGGTEKYRSVIFVNSTSEISSIQDLRGKIIAFESSSSTSAYFLPKAHLLKEGLELRSVEGPGADVGDHEIGYYFTHDDEKVFDDVRRGAAAAGALSEDELRKYSSTELTKNIVETPYIFRHLVTQTWRMEEELSKSLLSVLTSMNDISAGIAVLENFGGTSRFENLDHHDSPYEGIEEFVELVISEVY